MTTSMPIGTIMPWFKSLTGISALDPEWVECNGVEQAIPKNSPYADVDGNFTPPDLDGKFLRGSTTSGTTGGADSHNHSVSCADGHPYGGGGTANSCGTTSTTSHLPPYEEAVWIIKVL